MIFFPIFFSVCMKTKEAPVLSVGFCCGCFFFNYFFISINKEKAIILLG